MSKPITPDEVITSQAESLPDAVVEAFNELIIRNWDGRMGSHVLQEDVVERITHKLNCDRAEVFANGWLNVEGLYRRAGWRVEYDKPGFNETYPAHFKFLREK